RRVFDQYRQVANLQIAEVEAIDARQLQPAQADLPDAGAQRIGNRGDAGALRRIPRDDRFLRSGIEDEILLAAAIHPCLDDDLVVDEAERHRVRGGKIFRIDVDRYASLECLQELDLRARPRGLVAAILVG